MNQDKEKAPGGQTPRATIQGRDQHMTNNTSIVQVVDGVPFTTSEVVAEHAGIEHRAALQLLETHQESIESAFGQVAFEMRAGYNNARVRIARLTEQQSTALLTLMRNTPAVVAFKISLVKAFAEATNHNVVALPSRSALAQMVLDAEKELGEAQSTIESQKPIVSYHDKFVAERDDIITVDNFASQYGSTGPKVRTLLKEKGIAVRRAIGSRWSDSAGRMVEEFEWRPRQGVRSSEWFEIRPQHNAPRLHNGQVRQTMYVLQFCADGLAAKLGLTEPQMFGGDAA